MFDFYEQIKSNLQENHVIIFINSDDITYIESEADKIFDYLDDIIQDKMNNLEAITQDEKYLCVRRVLNQMPKISNPGYSLMLLPNNEK